MIRIKSYFGKKRLRFIVSFVLVIIIALSFYSYNYIKKIYITHQINLALIMNDSKKMKKLLHSNPNYINHYFNNTGKKLLHLAIEKGEYNMVKLLILCGANVNDLTIKGEYPLELALVSENNEIDPREFAKNSEKKEIAKLLINNNANCNINFKSEFTFTPLQIASLECDEDFGKIVINKRS